MIDIEEVGTGGGSIARAVPPARCASGPKARARCRARSVTATAARADHDRRQSRARPADADRFLGGEMQLDLEAARDALQDKIATPLGLTSSKRPTASFASRRRRCRMSCAVTTERGLDAADFAMVAYGGAGPLHAVMVAREIGIAKVIVPRAPGHFSAVRNAGHRPAPRFCAAPGSRRSPPPASRR